MAANPVASHPSRLAEVARTSSDNGEAVTPGMTGSDFPSATPAHRRHYGQAGIPDRTRGGCAHHRRSVPAAYSRTVAPPARPANRARAPALAGRRATPGTPNAPV